MGPQCASIKSKTIRMERMGQGTGSRLRRGHCSVGLSISHRSTEELSGARGAPAVIYREHALSLFPGTLGSSTSPSVAVISRDHQTPWC